MKSAGMNLLLGTLLCLPYVAGAAAPAPAENVRWQTRAEHVHIIDRKSVV